MTIKYIVGDTTNPYIEDPHKSQIIAHICNDVGGWGRGFVLAVSKKWSQPETSYRTWYREGKWKGKPFVLGQIQNIWVEDLTFVCNMIAQRDHKPLTHNDVDLGLPNVNYSSLVECLKRLNIECSRTYCYIHMPRIGAGLGGGNWKIIEGIINKYVEAPVFVYDLSEIPGTEYYKIAS